MREHYCEKPAGIIKNILSFNYKHGSMSKFILLFLLLACTSLPCSAQKDNKTTTLSPEASKQLINQIAPETSKRLLSSSSREACHCIDSVLQVRKVGDSTKILQLVRHCISSEVTTYQLSMKMLESLKSGEKNITINSDQNSAEYKKYYREIEDWLVDSCDSLRLLMTSNEEKETEASYSNDPEAIKQYNDGIKLLNKGDYAGALPYFKKAVEADSRFAYAWDNVGICSRRTGDLDNALKAYNKSLELSPGGKTPLQNIPVVYEMKKEYAKAIEAYKNFLNYFPHDAEAYYGMGRIGILYTDDMENGVDNMCKAYNLYVKNNSPYRSDAQSNLAYAYKKMKEQGKEEQFFTILKNNNISAK
ncbi:MAG TPA: hypothetical protein DCQ97_02070 [Chitinophagaceae bacterium]|nr:hypothetical protein [Chitinophagaceae bacterium]